jgi:hypothetical protein
MRRPCSRREGQTPPLIATRNGSISLFTMAEKQEGSASKENQPAPLTDGGY